MNKKEQVKSLLDNFSKVDKKKIPKKDNSIDMSKFYDVPEVIQLTKELKELGINTKWLFKNGFVAAGMLLKIK